MTEPVGPDTDATSIPPSESGASPTASPTAVRAGETPASASDNAAEKTVPESATAPGRTPRVEIAATIGHTEPVPADETDPTRTDLAAGQDRLAERIEDLARVIARQAAGIDRLADDARARAQRERQGADLPLVTELFALLGDTTACANTAESDRERRAFEAVAARIERLLVGRGGSVVSPVPGEPFDSLRMEAADVVNTDSEADDRTVDSVLQPGLSVPGRSVRPARVVVRRFR
ncbi:nucleotide exchange factor GrpE [Nocardia arizonensis]|uniref:nucleotide exchange factor GrpE n=1 Tax=Nocardia arizonensis TaxID=1141647 RepID=UPI0009EC37A1|nr:nucleotide exchange factor GrpE [Nocardia arizonensis]